MLLENSNIWGALGVIFATFTPSTLITNYAYNSESIPWNSKLEKIEFNTEIDLGKRGIKGILAGDEKNVTKINEFFDRKKWTVTSSQKWDWFSRQAGKKEYRFPNSDKNFWNNKFKYIEVQKTERKLKERISQLKNKNDLIRLCARWTLNNEYRKNNFLFLKKYCWKEVKNQDDNEVNSEEMKTVSKSSTKEKKKGK